MHKITCLLCLVLSFGFLAAQNYHPFPAGEFLYGYRSTALDSFQRSLQIDSVYASGTDSVFLFNEGFFDTGQALLYPTDNVAGQGVLRSSTGDLTFFTSALDSFYLPVSVSVGDTFAFTPVREGVLVARTTTVVFGQVDSVLVYDLDSGLTVRLSRSFGLLEVPVLVEQHAQRQVQGGVLRLLGIPDRQLGDGQPDFGDYFASDVGDHLQYEEARFYGFSSDDEHLFQDLEVLSRVVSGDTVTLEFRRQTFGYYQFFMGNPSQILYPLAVDTVSWVLPGRFPHPTLANFYFPTPPGPDVKAPAGGADMDYLYLDLEVDNAGKRSRTMYLLEAFEPGPPNTYNYGVGLFSRITYQEQLGLVQHYTVIIDNAVDEFLRCHTLPPAGTVGSCEDPQDYLVGVEPQKDLQVSVGPNPFRDRLAVEVGAASTARLVDGLGRVVLGPVDLAPGRNVLAVEGLHAGGYWLVVEDGVGKRVVVRVFGGR